MASQRLRSALRLAPLGMVLAVVAFVLTALVGGANPAAADPAALANLQQAATHGGHTAGTPMLHFMAAPTPRGVDVTKPMSTAALYKRAGILRDTTATPVAVDGPTPVEVGYVPAGKPHLSSLSQHVDTYCGGTGSDGKRVQVIYARETGTTDRFSQVEALLRNEVANVDDVFAVSAAETGGGRRVRWVADASCVPTIARVELPVGSFTDFTATINALDAKGYNSASRKYLVFAEANRLCGIGNMYSDERPTGNVNDGYAALYARVDTGCWATGTDEVSTAAHEVMHTLGSIQNGAPNSTQAGHCTDDGDLMCYVDTSGKAMRQVCPVSHEPLYDCNHNDYFSTNPPSTNYLATHWNTANSSFLATAVPLGQNPTATISGPATSKTGETITLSVSAPGATGFQWTGPSIISSATSATIKATPTTAGTATYAVRALFANNVTVDATQNVVVAQAPAPTVTVAAPTAVASGTLFTATASATVTGAATYRWTVGVGCLASGSTGQASVSATCATDVVGQSVPLQVSVTQTDAQSSSAVKDVSVTAPLGTVERWAGADRFASSAAFSAKSFAPGVGVAYVANGMNFPDALSGAPIAGKNGGPVLLTGATSLPAPIANELTRLQPKKIVVLGGTGAVSDTVLAKLDAYTTGTVERWAGSDRFASSAMFSSKSYAPGLPVVYVANGLNFPDALSGAPIAGKTKGPVLLTSATSLPSAIATELARLNPQKIVVLGGTGAVSSSVETALKAYLG